MRNELTIVLVLTVIIFLTGIFLRYFWWLILIVIGVYIYRYHQMKKSIESAQKEMFGELNEHIGTEQAFEKNHDIIEAEFTEHEEQGNTYDH